MSRVPTGFIHIKEYYNINSKNNNITPCSSTELYHIRKSLIKQHTNISISTAHLVLDYFEKYRNNSKKISEEWERLEQDRLQSFEGTSFQSDKYCLKMFYLCDYTPQMQMYVLQANPVCDLDNFWSYIWSQKITKYIYLQKHSEAQQTTYWPDEGSILCSDFEITTVSLHLSSTWYCTRNFFIKNIQTNETNTITQFHFIDWPSNKQEYKQQRQCFLTNLLQFRREYKASYSDQGCPIIIQSGDGVDIGGIFVVLDSLLTRLMNGVREIDVEGCMEHFRDQCLGIIKDGMGYEMIFDAISMEMLQICEALNL